MSFGEPTYPVAKKEHQCAHCKGKIAKGEKHYKYVGMYEGDFQNWRMHNECQELFTEYMDMTDNGICENRHEKGKGCSDCLESPTTPTGEETK